MIRYPFMAAVSPENVSVVRVLGLRPVHQEQLRATVWCAPRWIAWLYRWLPVHVLLFSDEGRADGGCWICCGICAPRWAIGVIRARQADGIAEPYVYASIRPGRSGELYELRVGPGRLVADRI